MEILNYFDSKYRKIQKCISLNNSIKEKQQEAEELTKAYNIYKSECEELIKSCDLNGGNSNKSHVEERFNKYFKNYVDQLMEIKKSVDEFEIKKSILISRNAWLKDEIEKGEKQVKQAMKHPDKLGAGAKKRKKLSSKKDKFKTVMEEFARGTLHSSDGKIVTDRDQALAIAYSESGIEKSEVEKAMVTIIEGHKSGIVKDEEYEILKGELQEFIDLFEEYPFEKAIKGGLADNKSLEDIAKKHKVDLKHIQDQLKMGMKVEKEHTDDKSKAEEIAKDHLFEDPDYYTKLAKMEKKSEENVLEKSEKEESEFTDEEKNKIEKFIKNYKGEFKDEDIHNFAEKLGLDKHEVEEYIYLIAQKKLKKAEDNIIEKSKKIEENRGIVSIECSKSGAYELAKLILWIAKIGNTGHSYSIILDPENNDTKKELGWDGDGSDRIFSVKLNGEEKKLEIKKTTSELINKSEEDMIAKEPSEPKSQKKYADALVWNSEGKMLFLKRSKDSEMFPGQWGLVGGHIDINESPKDSVIRELKEETGIEIKDCKEIAQANNPIIHYFEINLNDDEIVILEGTEHNNLKWMNREEWENEDLIVSLKENLKKIYDIGYQVRKL